MSPLIMFLGELMFNCLAPCLVHTGGEEEGRERKMGGYHIFHSLVWLVLFSSFHFNLRSNQK